ncbi:MAG: alginate export family protein [Candidatus Electryonea clarkiae]|nr:alginate export family protein [Candidatus Electryonea clarkiae]MDP8285329.1 alginate export family protein [Candidatus Electryonea clarkiae]
MFINHIRIISYLKRIAVCILLSISLISQVIAAPVSTVSNLDFRGRSEIAGEYSDDSYEKYSDLRLTWGTLLKSEYLHSYVQFQVPYRMGTDSRITSGDPILEINSSWIEIQNLLSNSLSLKAGRFSMNYGDGKLIGSEPWNERERVFDGLLMQSGNDSLWADMFITKQSQRNNPQSDESAKEDYFAGIWAGYSPIAIESFFLVSLNSANPTVNKWRRIERRQTFGVLYSLENYNKLDVSARGALQTGLKKDYRILQQDRTISAYQYSATVAYNSSVRLQPKISAGIDISSGDDPNTHSEEAFDNLYYDRHARFGDLDMFTKSVFNNGLRDRFIQIEVNPLKDLEMQIALHRFDWMQNIEFATNSSDRESLQIGNEIDFKIEYSPNNEISVLSGIAYFSTLNTKGIGTTARNNFRCYIQIKAVFNVLTGKG